jgi:putative membrane protein
MLDFVLAISHHLLIFGIFGILFVEFCVVRPGLTQVSATRLASIDLWYGVLAAVIVAVGFCRAVFAAKGWTYYAHNFFFWAKIASFAAIGLLSVKPTVEFIRWRNRAPDPEAIRVVRRYLHIELGLFALLPIFAAAMARGFGEF